MTAPSRLGPYRVLGCIGRGAMGEVFVAEEAGAARRRVALKALAPTLALAPEAARRFEHEAAVLARLDSPRIVRVLSPVERDGDRRFFAMELVIGKSLAQVVEETGSLAPARAIALAIDVLRGLEAAHDAGVVHRDVKPSNVLVDRDGRARLTDFGLARAADGSSLTASGATLGTPAYMSPEQARGEEATTASDLYSAGVVLYELLAGSPPFVASSPVALLRAHADLAPPPLVGRAPGLPPALAALVHRAMEKDPRKRPPSGEAFALELEALLPEVAGARPASGDPVGPAVRRLVERDTAALLAVGPGRAGPRARRRALAIGLGALAAVAAIMAVAALRGFPTGPAAPPAPSARVEVEMTSGERISGVLLRIDAAGLHVRGADGVDRVIERTAIREIRHARVLGGGR